VGVPLAILAVLLHYQHFCGISTTTDRRALSASAAVRACPTDIAGITTGITSSITTSISAASVPRLTCVHLAC
jgi:hypothetical protein